jgi:hypothetical protein
MINNIWSWYIFIAQPKKQQSWLGFLPDTSEYDYTAEHLSVRHTNAKTSAEFNAGWMQSGLRI